ncbi:2-dehydropantoate 2-reductase [Streptomyces sp. NPDC032940]|uniref:2-dehydropantoate 2-reductase n=1 Tax=Streptomyces sp. NPDC032940 TaxID=3155366 RepID=UPI0033C2FF34
MSSTPPRIAILGAGSIGCYLGGRLAAVADVTLIGRPSAMTVLRDKGLTLTRSGAPAHRVPPIALRTATGADAAADADIVLITVKSADTLTAARDLAPHLGERTVVCSFQNGVHNTELLRRALPEHIVLAGMVPYNVVQTEPGHFHQGSGGSLMLDDTPAARVLASALGRAGLAVRAHADMRGVQYAKLLMNLNNALNALSGQPLRRQLAQRSFRRCLALCQAEALAAFRAEDITPARLTPIPPALTPHLLRLPDGVFRRVAGRTLAIDAHARSSMWEDLERGRATEIDHLQGEIVTMAARHALPAPVSARVVHLVREAETAPPGRRRAWTGPDLLAELTSARRAS